MPSRYTYVTANGRTFRLDRFTKAIFKEKSERQHMTSQQLRLLEYFVSHPRNMLITQAELREGLYGKTAVNPEAVPVAVKSLRKVLGIGFIETDHGKGFRFVAEIRHSSEEDGEPPETQKSDDASNKTTDIAAKLDEILRYASQKDDRVSRLIADLTSRNIQDCEEAVLKLRRIAERASAVKDALPEIHAFIEAGAAESEEFGWRLSYPLTRQEALDYLDEQRNLSAKTEMVVSAIISLFERIEIYNDKFLCLLVDTLKYFGTSAFKAVPVVAKLLKSDSFDVRRDAAICLAMIGSGEAVAALIEAYDTYPDDPNCISTALICLNPSDVTAIARLIDAFENKEGRIRADIAFVLGGFGSRAKQAIPALVRQLSDLDDSVIQYAARALWKIGEVPANAVGALVKAANKSENGYTRKNAYRALGRISPVTNEVVEAIVRGLADTSFEARLGVIDACRSIGVSAVSALSAALTDPRRIVRENAADVLQSLNLRIAADADRWINLH